ncbi:10865_t:CDS:2 [Funneliformis geosporum]|uniref:Phospho-2-dehydro-3-deoxyheptonate aldolase n=1 Tax=Funneliformis geosporum TaxID=1117311 RepID=A0A9W4SMN2_9GLOM|nr:10865_t:CDS:2 [Funneliformis geosporum]
MSKYIIYTGSEWSLHYVRSNRTQQEYQTIVDHLTNSLNFIYTIGTNTSFSQILNSLNSIDLFISYEGLLLDYEQSLTRLLSDPETAHVEYFRGIQNPIGIKVGPSMKPDELQKLLDIVNPNKKIGKITLITCYGAHQIIRNYFINAPLILFVSTKQSLTGVKTRHFNSIIEELSKVIHVHKDNNSQMNGVHFELIGEGVTECICSIQLAETDLSLNYKTACDP